ncbi:MAG: FAD:protein FMN transferase [Lachnospiraceae bacterium]|nr:FAD:protein FMN transferase [Lachnospiraceae bacterium]
MNTRTCYQFDTVNTITADCPDSVLEEAVRRCEAYHRRFSRFEPDSEIARINRSSGAPVPVSEDTVRMLRAAEEVSAASDGAFSLSVGRLVSLWNCKAEKPEPPSEDRILAAREEALSTGYEICGDAVVKTGNGDLDLGGIAKGYIADRIADLLREAGTRHGLLNFGGNIVTIGGKEDGCPWRIGLQTPGAAWGKAYWAAVESTDGTVVTSGITERGFEHGGKWYHHIIDPRTGRPAETDLLSVTVIGTESMTADALATAALILGPDAGLGLLHRFGTKGVFLLRDGTVVRSKDLRLLM